MLTIIKQLNNISPHTMIFKQLSRWQAFGIHLFISALILIALLAIILFIWFPYDLIFAGGIDGLKIMMGVDLVLGPLLTLVVFAPGKKGLKLDLTLIGLLQVTCLSAGLWLVYNERPLVQLLADDGVYLLAASDFKNYQMKVDDLPSRGPKNVLLDLPENRASLGAIKFTSELVDEKPFTFRTDLYIPMNEITEERFTQRITFIQEPMTTGELEIFAKFDTHDNCAWIPIHSKHVFGYACTNRQDGIIHLSEHNY